MKPHRNVPRQPPQAAVSLQQLALSHLASKRWREAMDAFGQAFERDPQGLLDRRPCMDWFRTIQFDLVPDFWRKEVTRFFKRADIDKTRYVGAALNVLMADPAFRAVVGAGQSPEGFAPERAALERVMRDELFALLLRDTVLAQSRFEIALTRLRAALLLDRELRDGAPPAFLCNLALQCHNNEHAYCEGQTETGKLGELASRTEAELRAGAWVDDRLLRSIALVAMYRPLHTVRGVEALLGRRHASDALERLLRRAAGEVLEEHRLRAGIGTLAVISDPVSLEVRAQYEENPYPRWLSFDRWPPVSFGAWIAEEVPDRDAQRGLAASPRLLVAGCGTGVETLSLATRLPEARIVALDLSLASLAYAKRMAQRLGFRNVEFRHADILGLAGLEERFDLVYSTGVLHHLRDPSAGVRALARLLSPGGLLKVGLYSARAHAGLKTVRELARRQGFEPAGPSIREFRRQVLLASPDSPLRGLLRFTDFFSLSGCRDLVFNVQEHQFGLPQAGEMLRQAGLTVLGLSQLPPGIADAFRAMYPGEDVRADLNKWDAFEASYPDTFVGMFHLWSRLPVQQTA